VSEGGYNNAAMDGEDFEDFPTIIFKVAFTGGINIGGRD